MKLFFLKSNFFKSVMLALVAISNPLYSISEPSFFLLSSLIILVSLIYCDIFNFKVEFNNISDWGAYKLTIPWLQIVFFFFVILIITYLMAGTKYNQSVALIIFICWLTALIMLYGICRNILSLVLKIKQLATEANALNLKAVAFICFGIIFISIAPDLVFAFIYSLFFVPIENVDDLSILESFYLSIIISNTLPIGAEYTKYISVIGEHTYIYLFQILQVIINKIINLFVIGIILNYLFLVINSKRACNEI
ncbi:hypothetical protein [Lysinibacillus pakistanensis]|uniref:hypothetical protein n=1 Tax=Lysinibacillus pakistanensis TaxID=759811 RepID=UPI003D2BACDD